MQAQTGCKVQIQKEHELQPGQTTRKIFLQGVSEAALDQVQTKIENMVRERVSSFVGGMDGGSSGQDPKIAAALAQGHLLVSVDVPDADVGLVIGKMGSTIRHIQDSTGAQVQVPQTTDASNSEVPPNVRRLQVTHPTQQGAEQAKAMILQLVESRRGSTPMGSAGGGPQTTVEVQVSMFADYFVWLVFQHVGADLFTTVAF